MYHMTDDGPKPCIAKPGNCRKKGEHFNSLSDAEKAYHNKQEPLKRLRKQPVQVGLPQTEFKNVAQGLKYNSYVGVKVSETLLQEHLQAWRQHVGAETAEAMETAKIQRDGGYYFHVTLLTPKETRQLRKSGVSLPVDTSMSFTLDGVGSVRDGEKEAWYILVKSPVMNAWRRNAGLPPKDFHITIGFIGGDVHTVDKNDSTKRIV